MDSFNGKSLNDYLITNSYGNDIVSENTETEEYTNSIAIPDHVVRLCQEGNYFDANKFITNSNYDLYTKKKLLEAVDLFRKEGVAGNTYVDDKSFDVKSGTAARDTNVKEFPTHQEYIDYKRDQKEESLDEGILFHSKGAKEIRKKILEMVKEYNKGHTFLDKLKMNLKQGTPPKSVIDKMKNKIRALFDSAYFTGIVIKARSYYTGSTYIYYEYYAFDVSAIKDNVFMNIEISMSGSSFGYPGIVDFETKDDKANITKEDIKTIIDILDRNSSSWNCIDVSVGKKVIKLHNATARFRKDLFNEIYMRLKKELNPDSFELENGKLFSSITIKKKASSSLHESTDIVEEATDVKFVYLYSKEVDTIIEGSDEEKSLIQRWWKEISASLEDHIYNYYHQPYILQHIEDQKVVSRESIKKNFVIYKIDVEDGEPVKGAGRDNKNFSCRVSCDWSKEFLKSDYKKIHDDHIPFYMFSIIKGVYQKAKDDFMMDG